MKTWAYIIVIVSMVFTFGYASAGSIKNHPCMKYYRGGSSNYWELTCDDSVHIYYGIYALTLDHTIKMKGTHADSHFQNKPPQFVYSTDGKKRMWNTKWLKWIATLKYKHLTEKGDKFVTLDNHGTDSIRKTKQGKYYMYVWENDEMHDRFVKWCEKKDIERGK